MNTKVLLPCLLALASTASASIITGPSSQTGNTIFNTTVSTPAPGNNNVPGGNSPNTINIFETVNATGTWGLMFNLVATAPSTEYRVIKTIVNNTNLTWTQFGVAIDSTGFDPSNPSTPVTGVTWDLDSFPSITGPGTSGQSVLSAAPPTQVWSGLNIAPGASITIEFSIDTCASCVGAFTITQGATGVSTPNVPEPSACALIGSGLLALVLRLRRPRQ